eukprot:13848784-Alexandrium_andersonii.AAC.1
MSASLVGSEMCIRDSPSRFRAGSEQVFEQVPSRCSAGSEGVPSRFRAVSYTHLTLPTICSV